MHVPINVKSPNNISKWQMGFNSRFKGLILPPTYHVTELIIMNKHLRLLHAGLISQKYRSLDTCGVRAVCVYLPCRLDYALLCCYTPLFNPSACSPLNNIAKTVSTTPITRSTIIECLLEALALDKKN
jgi:hypothetical protein